MNNINNTEKGIGWLERVMILVSKYSLWEFFKGIFIILLTFCLISFISNPQYIFEKYKEWSDKEHSERLEVRMKNNEKMHILSQKLLYKVDADRVLILELHNGLENSNGLPFSKCSATYEVLNEGILPVSNQYQNTNLSLVPFANLMFRDYYWCGDVDDIEEIDRGLFYKLKSNGTEHFACTVIRGVDKPLALLFVSFKDLPEEGHKCMDIKNDIEKIALELSLFLELNKN